MKPKHLVWIGILCICASIPLFHHLAGPRAVGAHPLASQSFVPAATPQSIDSFWETKSQQAIARHPFKPTPTPKPNPTPVARKHGKAVRHVADFIVNGAGDASANGVYTPSGTHNGAEWYSTGSGYAIWYNGSTDWFISASLGSTDKYSQSGTSAGPPIGVWTLGFGASPAPVVFPDAYTVSGAGSTDFNGVYNYTGLSLAGTPYFQIDVSHLLYFNGGASEWILSGTLDGAPGSWTYEDGSGTTPDLTGWSVSHGTSPAPTLSIGGGGPPTITGFTPTSAGVGRSIVITGTNFTGATAIKFDTIDAASFSVDSDTQITAVVSDYYDVTGALPIKVTTPAGTVTSSGNFTIAPIVSSSSIDGDGNLTVNFASVITPPMLPGSGASGFLLNVNGNFFGCTQTGAGSSDMTFTTGTKIFVGDLLQLLYEGFGAGGNVSDSNSPANYVPQNGGTADSVTNLSTLSRGGMLLGSD